MRLDRTRIAIAERSQPETLDLSLLVLREFFIPVFGLVAILAGPLAILNWYLIEWMAADLIESVTITRYLWTMAILVYVEAPFASVLATSYLGKATFYESPTAWEVCKDVASLGGRVFWTQLVCRGVLLVIAMVWSLAPDDSFSSTEGMLMFVCFGLFVLRSLRPYINEIVLLERSPIMSRSPKQITVGKRSSRLHGPNSGDLFGRGIAMIPVMLALGMSVLGLLWFGIATFSNDWAWGPVMVHFVVPAVFWILAAYVTVFRFLSYLDLRIRREGWEVELKMRAEANRMSERMSSGSLAGE